MVVGIAQQKNALGRNNRTGHTLYFLAQWQKMDERGAHRLRQSNGRNGKHNHNTDHCCKHCSHGTAAWSIISSDGALKRLSWDIDLTHPLLTLTALSKGCLQYNPPPQEGPSPQVRIIKPDGGQANKTAIPEPRMQHQQHNRLSHKTTLLGTDMLRHVAGLCLSFGQSRHCCCSFSIRNAI